MTNQNDNVYPSFSGRESGLSKRELFAAMAMQGLCSCHSVLCSIDNVAEYSVLYADALIENLNKSICD